MNQPVRVGIVGAGYVSAYHIRAVQSLPYAAVVGIADVNRSQAEEMARRFGIPAVYGSLAEMEQAAPQVIHILTPPSSHKLLALKALDMGCHVLVEKPMAESAAECDAMIAKAREKNLTLSVNHSARFDPVILDALQRVRRGDIGEVLHVEFLRSSEYAAYAGGPLPPPYRTGSYPFQDLGVHGLYLLEAFLGEIREVNPRYAASGRDMWLTFDEWRCDVTAANGATGHMMLSWNNRPVQNEIVVHGTKGVLRAECFLQVCTVRRLFPGPKPGQWVLNGVFTSLRTLWQVPMNTLRFATGKLKASPGIHQSAIDFHEALHKGQPAPVPAEEGRRMVAFLEAVSERADEEKRQRRDAMFRPLEPARILVTGATGFLGSALLRKLRASTNEPIRILVRRPPANCEGLQVVCADLGDAELIDDAIRGVEIVYHVGATMKGAAAEFERGTVWGTQHVIESCLRHGVRRLVYVSSLSVLDHAGHKPGTPVTESSPVEPHPDLRGAYTQTKLKAEQLVTEAVRTSNLPAVILRPGQIFGPGAEGVTPSGTIGIAGRWLVVGSGKRALPLVYVDDVADALVLASTKDEAVGHVIQLVDPNTVTQRQYVARCRPPRVNFVPTSFMMLVATGVELLGRVLKRSVPLTRYRVRSIFPLDGFDQTAAVSKLGWKPSVGVAEGLNRTFPAR
jgi:predicted dehydrogenase/nucleoside-diphosphate-sugar epimerase